MLHHKQFSIPRRKAFDLTSLFILSLATLLYEINLTRLYSVTQYYHFAFLIIGFAMFGFGASGSCFALFPQLSQSTPWKWMVGFCLGYTLTCCAGYILMNAVPFDSFSIAWDWRQGGILALHSLVLSLPFFCSGALLNLCFTLFQSQIGQVYACNLIGSAIGCVLAMLLPGWIGGGGIVWLSAILGVIAAIFNVNYQSDIRSIPAFVAIVAISGIILLILLINPPFLSLRLSPYKDLSYVMQYPDMVLLSETWNGFSRVDVASSRAIRSLPGLSYTYMGVLPTQNAVFIDGDSLSGILVLEDRESATKDTAEIVALDFTRYLPSAIAYLLRPGAHTLVLEPQGGLEVWTALAQKSSMVTVVESNPLIIAAVPDLYQRDDVQVIREDARSFTRACFGMFDIISLPLTAPYRPIRSGAYSLMEDYHQTQQAYQDYLKCASPEGLVVITKWLQTPPSECLRVFTTVVSVLEDMGLTPSSHIIAFRGYNTMTFLVSRVPFTIDELQTLRSFTDPRAYDLVFSPDIDPGEVNLHNILPEAVYYETFNAFLRTENRSAWYKQYPFDVKPTTDNHPFFGHYFKMSQTRQIFAELGKTWQPFGGAGYFVIIILLALSLCAALVLFLIPMLYHPLRKKGTLPPKCGGLLIYGLLGLAYLFVEIPLTQRFILYLGHPAYAMTAVLCVLLTASGLGSLLAHKGLLQRSLLWIVILGIATAIGFELGFNLTLNLSLIMRMGLTGLLLFPLGMVMGMPFAQGIRAFHLDSPRCIAYAWSVNGATSVVASVLAAYLALAAGFRLVFFLGIGFYALAGVVAFRAHKVRTPLRPHP